MIDDVFVPIDAQPGLLIDGRVKVTNFGFISNLGSFVSTRCQPYDYRKFGSIPAAQTLKKPSTHANARRNLSLFLNNTQPVTPQGSQFGSIVRDNKEIDYVDYDATNAQAFCKIATAEYNARNQISPTNVNKFADFGSKISQKPMSTKAI